MKKTSKILSLVLALCLVFSLSALAANGEPAGDFAQVDATHWQGGSVTITGVEYDSAFDDVDGSSYVDSTLFTSVSKILYDGGEIAVDAATQTAVLTVDGVQYDLYNIAEATTFTGDVEITLVEKGDSSSNNGAPFGADKSTALFGAFYYTPAIYISNGAYDAAKSVEAAVIEGEVSSDEINGLKVDSEGDYFSAVYVVDSDVAINDADIRLIGACGDDFNGWGAGIVALGSSNVEVNRSYIYGCGVLRSGIFVSGSAQVLVNDSVIITENDETAVPYSTEDNYATPMMQQCPFALGIEGNIRATISCGSGCNTFTNSLVVSNGWAVLSTDSGKSGATALVANSMVAVVGSATSEEPSGEFDFSYEVNGTPWYVTVGRFGETSGYIAYADSGVLDFAYGSAWYSPDYLGIITSGTITMADNCYGYSGRVGFLLHSGGNGSGTGTLDVSDSSFDIQDIFAVTFAQGTYSSVVNLSNADIAMANAGRDILFIQKDTDDNAGGPGETSNSFSDISYEDYLNSAASSEPAVSTLNITDSHVQGNVYNATTLGTGLNVTIDNSELDGEISSAWSYHVDLEGEALGTNDYVLDYYTGTADGEDGVYDYTLYCRVDADASPCIGNNIYLTLSNGSVWMVTGTNYLSSLTIDDTSSIQGMSLVMTVDGVETEIAAGTYEGEIVISAGDAPERGEGDAEIKAPVIGEAAELAAVETEAEFVADSSVAPFNVDVGEGMVLEFTEVQYAFGDGTVSIYIPDTAKLIECEIQGDEWVFADADFVDEAIIATAKSLYAGADDAAPAAAAGGNWDAWIAYLNELLDTDTTLDIYDMVKGELETAQESDYTGMEDGTVFGVFANLYNATPYEDFAG